MMFVYSSSGGKLTLMETNRRQGCIEEYRHYTLQDKGETAIYVKVDKTVHNGWIEVLDMNNFTANVHLQRHTHE